MLYVVAVGAFQVQLYGDVTSVQAVIKVVVLAARAMNTTLLTVPSGSLAVAVKVVVAPRV